MLEALPVELEFFERKKNKDSETVSSVPLGIKVVHREMITASKELYVGNFVLVFINLLWLL